MKSILKRLIDKNFLLYKFMRIIKGLIFDIKYSKNISTSDDDHNFYNNIESYRKNSKKLKVLWVGINENTDKSGLIEGLEENFILTTFIRPNGQYGLIDSPVFSEDIREENGNNLFSFLRSLDDKPDLIFGQFMGNNINIKWLRKIKEKFQKPLISISWDDKLVNLWGNDYEMGCHSISKELDLVLCSSFDFLSKYSNSKFFPMGSSKRIFWGDVNSSRDIDVIFVGNKYGLRWEIVKRIKDEGINIEAYGEGWDNGFVNFKECARLFKQSKIIIGSGYVSHSSKVTTLKLRDFDSSITGALYLTSYNKELDYLFKNNEIEFYNNFDELIGKIKFYLKNEKLRLKKARELQKTTLNYYQWGHLFKNLESSIKI